LIVLNYISTIIIRAIVRQLCTTADTRVHWEKSRLMPDQPTWLERVPAIEAALQAQTAPALLDRAALESLFGVRRRRAIALLHRCGGYRKGRGLVAKRDSVLAFLAETRADGTFEELAEQKHRVAAFLGEARLGLTLPSIRILEPARLSDITVAGLPAGIQLSPGRLTVTFGRAEELIEKLFTLAQALANDYASFEAALGRAAAEGGPDGVA